jgi:arylsulfatase A-like enzyme
VASLPLAARRLFGRMMEVFAGFLTHADHQVGRLIEFLPRLGTRQHADHDHPRQRAL